MIRAPRDLTPILSLFQSGPRKKLVFGLLLSATTALSALALLGLSGWFITATAIAGLSTATAFAFDVFSPSAGIRFFALARTASRYSEQLVTHDATLGIIAELRERLFRGSAAMREAEKLRKRPAALLFRLTQDIDALDSFYLRIIAPFSAATAAALAVGTTLSAVQTGAGGAAALSLLIVGCSIPMVCARMARPAARRRMLALEALRSRVIDLVSGQTELIMADQIGAQRRAIAKADRALADADGRINLVEITAGAAFGIASAVFVSSALCLVLIYARTGDISAPTATLVVLVAVAALEPFTALRRGAVELGRTLLAARRVAPRLSPVSPSSLTSPRHGVACSLDGIRIRYANASRPAIEDLSLMIRTRERVALIGTSGSGKSSLLSLMSGEILPDAGVIACLPATLITQRTELFADTLRDNLRIAYSGADDEQLSRALAAAGLSACVARLPEGLDTRLGEGGLGLSGGEARRLALARLFLRDTPLWLLDEPTDGLDGGTAHDVLQRVAAKADGRAVVIATHIRREAEIADRLVVIESGRIVVDASRGEPKFETLLASLKHD